MKVLTFFASTQVLWPLVPVPGVVPYLPRPGRRYLEHYIKVCALREVDSRNGEQQLV